jgi:hypothetical protein
MKIAEANAPMEITQIPLIIKNIMENSFLVTINTRTTKIHNVIDAQFVQAIIDGLRALSDKPRTKPLRK